MQRNTFRLKLSVVSVMVFIQESKIWVKNLKRSIKSKHKTLTCQTKGTMVLR